MRLPGKLTFLRDLNTTQKVFGNTLAQVGGRIAVAIIGLFTFGVITRSLGVHGFGQYATAFGFVNLVGVLIDLGLYVIIVRVCSTGERDPRGIVDNVVGLRIAMFAVAFLGIVVAQFFLPYDAETKKAVIIGAISLLGISLNQTLGGVFQAAMRMDLFVIGDLAGRGLTLGLAWYLLHVGHGLEAVVWAVVVGYVLNLAVTLYFIQRFQPVRAAFDTRIWRWILSEGIPLGILIILGALYLRLDVFLLSLFRPSNDVGIYTVAAKPAEIIMSFALMLVGPTLPVFARLISEQNREKLQALAGEVYDVMLAMGFGLIVGAVFAGGPIVHLVAGHGYENSVLPLQILMGAVALNFLDVFYGQLIMIWREQRRLIRPTIYGVIFSIVGNLIIIPIFGYLGAAGVMVASEAIIFVGYSRIAHQVTGFRPPEHRLARLLLALLIMTAALVPVRQFGLIPILVTGTGVYTIALLALGVIQRDRLRELVRLRR